MDVLHTQSPEKDDAADRSALKGRAKSIDENTLNDPESLIKEEREATRAAIQEPEGKDDDFPDGGLRAWLVVFGVCYSSFVIRSALLTMVMQGLCTTLSR